MPTQTHSRRRPFAYNIAGGLGLATLILFAGGFWTNAFDSGAVRGVLILLSALAVAFFAATRSNVGSQVLTAVWAALVWCLALVLLGCAMTLAKFGSFEEGGPLGLALVFGIYFWLPVTVMAMPTAPLLGYLMKSSR